MKWEIYLIIIFLFLASFADAETTFFDNSDNVLIVGSFPTGEATEGEAISGVGCIYKWNCTNWSECFSSGKQTRNCTNIGSCFDKSKFPKIEQNCTYTVPEIKEGTENITSKEIINKKDILIYLIISLIILSVIVYLKKDYLKKLIRKYPK